MSQLSLLLFVLLLQACTAVTGSDFLARKKNGDLTSAERYHESLLTQLGDAWNARDLDRMNSLLDKSRLGAAPEQVWRYEQFETMYQDAWVHLVGFERMGFYVVHNKGGASAQPSQSGAEGPASKDFTMGERSRVLLKIEPIEGHGGKVLAKGPEGQRSTVFLEMQITDVLADGSRTQGTSPMKLQLDKDITFTTDAPYELEIPLIQEPDPDVYIRTVRLRGDLFPAGMIYDETHMKTGRFVLKELTFTRYPTGFRRIRAAPLKTLRNALEASARYRGHILISAHFIHRDSRKADVDKAVDLILASLPSAPPQAEPTLLYALQILVPEGGPLSRDRDGWLHWATNR